MACLLSAVQAQSWWRGLHGNEENTAVFQNLDFNGVARLEACCRRQRDSAALIGLREHGSFLHELENKTKRGRGQFPFWEVASRWYLREVDSVVPSSVKLVALNVYCSALKKVTCQFFQILWCSAKM